LGRNRLSKIHSGSVCRPGAVVNVVTTISSKDSANASTAAAISAERSCGNVTCRNVWKVVAPRSAEASSSDVPVRRSRARMLL